MRDVQAQGVEVRARMLDFIASSYAEHGYPPTVREIGAAVGLTSSSTVHHHLARLQREGRISHVKDSPRTIRILAPATDT